MIHNKDSIEKNFSASANLNEIVHNSKEFIENKIELEVLKGADKISQGIAFLVMLMAGGALCFIPIFFLLFALSTAINRAIGSEVWGYVIISGVSIVLLVPLLIIGKKSIKNTIINFTLKNIDDD